MKLKEHRKLARKVEAWRRQTTALRRAVDPAAARSIIDMLVIELGTLREVARRSGLSPTYISQTRRGKTELALDRYTQLVRMLDGYDPNSGA